MAPSDYQYEYFNVTFPEEYIALVEINRPERLNAFIEVMWHNLSALFRHLSHDPDVRCVLLTGAGDRAFSAGLDVQAAASSEGMLMSSRVGEQDVGRVATKFRRHVLEFQGCISEIERCEKLISLLHGHCLGLALDIATATDIRLSTPTARFSVKEVDLGLAADVGTLSRLPKVVGDMGWVKEVCMTARGFDGGEAGRVGLVRVVDGGKKEVVEEGLRVARVMVGKSPVAVQGTKRVIDYSRDHGVEDGLHYTAVWNSAMLQSKDVVDSIMAGIRKKKADFAKL